MLKRWIPMWVYPILIAFAIGTVWVRLSIVRISYEIDQTTQMLRNSQRELEKINLKVAQLRSPRHLEMLARKKFGLSPPTAGQVIQFGKID